MTEFNYRDMCALLKKMEPIALPEPYSIHSILGGIPVFQSDILPRFTTEIVRYPGHPFVKWLAKFFRFEPDILVERKIRNPENVAFMYYGKLVASPTAIDAIRAII